MDARTYIQRRESARRQATLRLALMLIAAVGIVLPQTAHAEKTTVVQMPAKIKGIKKRDLSRVVKSLRGAVGKMQNVSILDSTCGIEPKCLAREGVAAKAQRSVGIVLTVNSGGLGIELVAVEVSSGLVLERMTHALQRGKLQTDPGERLTAMLAVDKDPTLLPLSVSVRPGSGDGRTVLPVEVSGGPGRLEAELVSAQELPVVECGGAASLPAIWGTPPALLAPVVDKRTTLSCVARHRDAVKKFRITLNPPRVGLYADASPRQINNDKPSVELRAFNVNKRGGRSKPTALRAASSVGRITIRRGGLIALELPARKPPQLIAVALVDGKRAGAAFVPMSGITKLPVETERGAQVQVRIAGKWFGPVRARRKMVSIPIEVPAGVHKAVVRAVDHKGYVTEALADLKIPELSRLAAVAPVAELAVGARSQIAVAIAGPEGRPADKQTVILARAERGTVGTPKPQGGGLWIVPYSAPKEVGDDKITFRISGDESAGFAVVAMKVRAGKESRLSVKVPSGPLGPNDDLVGKVVVFDTDGNPIDGINVTVSLGGNAVAVTSGPDGLSFQTRIPEKLPPDGQLTLVVTAGKTRREVSIKTRADKPVSATVEASPDLTTARLKIAVRDRFGNLASSDAFEVSANGATVKDLVRRKTEYQTTIVAIGNSRVAEVEVRAGDQVLAKTLVRFEAYRFLIGAYGTGGWFTNGGAVSTPRGGAGIGLRRNVSVVEMTVLLGVEGFSYSDQAQLDLGGMQRDVDTSITAISVPLLLRGRLRLTRRIGASLGLGIVPMRVTVILTPDFQAEDRYVKLVVGVRAQLSLDAELGPGRVNLGFGYGRAKLAGGAVVGQLEGPAAIIGYEWWFADFGL